MGLNVFVLEMYFYLVAGFKIYFMNPEHALKR